jgi:hypothetical protein
MKLIIEKYQALNKNDCESAEASIIAVFIGEAIFKKKEKPRVKLIFMLFAASFCTFKLVKTIFHIMEA